MLRAPILAFPQLNVPFILDSDASDSGLVAVFSQVGKERVIAYAAHALSKAERTDGPCVGKGALGDIPLCVTFSGQD